MDTKTQAKFEALARIVKALAHPTRLFVVDRLQQRGEMCVCELAGLLEIDISTLSRHLTQLKSAGVLVDRKQGSRVFYRLRVARIANLFECIDAVLAAHVQSQQEVMV